MRIPQNFEEDKYTRQIQKSTHIVYFDQILLGKTKSRQANLRTIAVMEVPAPISIESVMLTSEKQLIQIWSNKCMKYQRTQYKHIMVK